MDKKTEEKSSSVLTEELLKSLSEKSKQTVASASHAVPSGPTMGSHGGHHDSSHGGARTGEPPIVPPRPPKGGSGGNGGHGGGHDSHGKSSAPFFKHPVFKIFLLFLGYLAFMEVQDMYADRASKRDTETKMAKIAVDKAAAESKKAQAVVTTPPVQTAAPSVTPEVQYAKMFDCSTPEKKINGFQEAGTQVFTSDVKFISGCALVQLDFPVGKVEGHDFVVEYPDKNDLTKSYKCDDAYKCVDFLNYLRDGKEGDKRFHFGVNNGGYIILRR